MLGGQIPVIVLKEGTEREKGRSAQLNNIAAAKAIADAVRTTLGPKGMDKMLVDSLGDVVITNDGVTILKKIEVEHPTAKMIVEAAKTQDQECGDGTTTAVVLAGELLKRAETLIEQNIHPTIIAGGYRLAATEVEKIIKKMSVDVKSDDEETLEKIALTAMGSKGTGDLETKKKMAKMAVKAVRSIVEKKGDKLVADIDNIKVEKKHGGGITDTELIDGIVLDKERLHTRMPKIVKDAKIALLNCALEIKKTETKGEIQIRDPQSLQKFIDEEERTLKNMVEKIRSSGANVVICEKGIDDLAQHYLAKYGIYAVRRAKESDMKKLMRATGGKIVTNLDDLTPKELGTAKLVEEKKIGDSDMTFITGCPSAKAVSILVRGGTEHVVDEVERALHDALKVVGVAIEDGKAVAGGGGPEIEAALRLREYAASVGGREQLAIEAFSSALEIIPWTLAENAGFNAMNVLIKLKSEHEGKRGQNMGIDVFTGEIKDMFKLNVIEPVRVKTQAIASATEVATMILRIDDVIASKKTEPPKTPPGGAPGAGGGYGGMPPGMM